MTTDRKRVLIDRELYIPQDSWFGDPDRCAEAAVPADLEFATRPAQVAAMIERARQAGTVFAWFTADEEFGQNPGLRDYLEAGGLAYVMAIPKNTRFSTAAGQEAVVENAAAGLGSHAWSRRACGIGAKGFRVYEWALIDSHDPHHHYLIRR